MRIPWSVPELEKASTYCRRIDRSVQGLFSRLEPAGLLERCECVFCEIHFTNICYDVNLCHRRKKSEPFIAGLVPFALLDIRKRLLAAIAEMMRMRDDPASFE